MEKFKQWANLIKKGIDESQFNYRKLRTLTLTLQLALAMGIDFIYIRVGYGRVKDWMFAALWAASKALGIKRMPYWYLDYYSHVNGKIQFNGRQISNRQWGIEQAERAWVMLKDDAGEGPLVCDMEESGYGWRITYFKRNAYQEVAQGFLERWKQLSGRDAIIYCSMGWLNNILTPFFKEFDLIIAWYNHEVTGAGIRYELMLKGWKGRALIHQYASNGDVDGDGIGDGLRFGADTRTLDLSEFIGTDEDWNDLWRVNEVTPEDGPGWLFLLDILIPNLSIRIGPSRKFESIRNADKGLHKVYETKQMEGEPFAFARITADKDEWVSLNPEFSRKVAK